MKSLFVMPRFTGRSVPGRGRMHSP
jgi:hypothetical protein